MRKLLRSLSHHVPGRVAVHDVEALREGAKAFARVLWGHSSGPELSRASHALEECLTLAVKGAILSRIDPIAEALGLVRVKQKEQPPVGEEVADAAPAAAGDPETPQP